MCHASQLAASFSVDLSWRAASLHFRSAPRRRWRRRRPMASAADKARLMRERQSRWMAQRESAREREGAAAEVPGAPSGAHGAEVRRAPRARRCGARRGIRGDVPAVACREGLRPPRRAERKRSTPDVAWLKRLLDWAVQRLG